jgi:hypothetical protein
MSMEEHISREMPLPAAGREDSAGPAVANPVHVENVRRPRKTRARIIQIVSLIVLVALLIVLWRFLGDKAAAPGAGTAMFSTQVNFGATPAAAFTLTRVSDGADVNFTATASIAGGVTVITLDDRVRLVGEIGLHPAHDDGGGPPRAWTTRPPRMDTFPLGYPAAMVPAVTWTTFGLIASPSRPGRAPPPPSTRS